jgi:RND family efflux transporter MFP subunit
MLNTHMELIRQFIHTHRTTTVAFAVVVVAALFGYLAVSDKEVERPVAARVTTAIVQESEVSGAYTFTGILEPTASTDLSAKAQGRVAVLTVGTGSRVGAGQLLVELDAATERATAESITEHIRATEQSLSAVDALYVERIKHEESPATTGTGQTSNLTALLTSAASLSDQVSDTLGTLLAVRRAAYIDPEIAFDDELGVRDSAQRMRARDELVLFQQQNNKYQDFFDTQILGKQPTDETITAGIALANETLLAATSILNQSYTTLLNTVVSTTVSEQTLTTWKGRLTGLGGEVDQTLNGMHNASANIAVMKKEREAKIADASAMLVALEGQQSVTNALISNSVVRAPFSGVITEKYTEKGAVVAPGVPLLAIADDSVLKIKIGIADTLINSFHVGDQAQVTVDGMGDTSFTAAITKIEPVVDAQSRKVTIELSVPNTDHALRVGSFARVTFALEGVTGAIVPTRAVRTRYDTSVAFVVVDDRVERRVVTVGRQLNDQIEIIAGLRRGETIVVEGNAYLRDGDSVSVMTAATTSSRLLPDTKLPAHD